MYLESPIVGWTLMMVQSGCQFYSPLSFMTLLGFILTLAFVVQKYGAHGMLSHSHLCVRRACF